MFDSSDLLSGRHVLVIGFGRQGRALARWLPTIGARVTVTDKHDADKLKVDQREFPRVRFALGDDDNVALLNDADLVCVSGGVPLEQTLVQGAIQRDITVTNDAQLFLERCAAPVVGITGSAGKTTTTTLVGDMMRHAGLTTWVGGNIGDVLLDVMVGIRPEHCVVMELSSFQLELVHTSPRVAAVLNITPNHLDRHSTMENYIRAKANILAFQSPGSRAVLNFDDPTCRLLDNLVSDEPVWFSRHEILTNGAFMIGQRLAVAGDASPDGDPHIVCELSEIPLRGEHNIMNVLAACAIAGAAGVSPHAMSGAIKIFRAVPHRLETVRQFNDVTYVNDSIATAPERVMAALHSYDEPLVLLAGGKDKNLMWDDMVALALQKSRHIVAFGQDGDIVVNAARRLGADSDVVTRVQTLDEAVSAAVQVAQPGDVVLLSPGGTSFDAYADFAARGEHFRQLVMAL